MHTYIASSIIIVNTVQTSKRVAVKHKLIEKITLNKKEKLIVKYLPVQLGFA